MALLGPAVADPDALTGLVDDDLPLDDSEEAQLEWEQVQAEWIATGFPGCEPAFPVAKDQPRAVDEGFVIVEPDEVKTKAQPSTGRKEVWTFTAVVLVAGLRYAFAEATAEGLWLQVSALLLQGGSLFQDAQSGEESTDLRCVSAKCLRDVGYAHGPQQADRRISEGSHDFRTGTLADPAGVLAHCDVTYVVRTILDRPMPPGPFKQLSRAGHRPRNTGDEVAGFVRGLAVLHHIALDLTDLCNTRPIQVLVQCRRRLQRATLDSTVSLVEGRRRVHGVIPDSLLPRGKKPLPREGRRPAGCHSGASVGCL